MKQNVLPGIFQDLNKNIDNIMPGVYKDDNNFIIAVGQTRFSKDQLATLINEDVKYVTIVCNNDKEGLDNTHYIVEQLLSETGITSFVMDPKELGLFKNPEEFVKGNGFEAFKELLNNLHRGSVWLAKRILDKNGNVLEKQRNIDEVIRIIQMLKSPIDIDEVISILNEKLALSKTEINKLIKSGRKKTIRKGKFWTINNDGIQIGMKDYVDFISEVGFSKYYLDKDYTFIRTKDNIVQESSLPQIKDHILSYIESIEEDEHDTKKQLYETLYNNVGKYFSEGLVECIPPKEIKFKRDELQTAYIYYKNSFVSLAKNAESRLCHYDELESPIWDHAINQRDIKLIKIKDKKSEYEQFIFNVVGGNEQRFLSLCSAIGYMLHGHKVESNAKAIVLCDQKIQSDGEPNGRTGKSLIGKALEKIKNVERVDGKNFGFKPTFTFQMVKLGTHIIDFNDVESNFDFEKLFSVITDGMTIEYKNKTPFVIPFSESPKIMISTNYTIKGIGTSYKDRMFEIELSDYYSPEHKPSDEFGHDFFTGWDEDEWNRFDNFMLECLQLYLDEGLVSCALVNLSQRKLIDQTSSEFVEFAKEYIEIGKEYNLTNLYNEFKLHIGFGNDLFDKCPIKQNSFTTSLSVYARFRELKLNIRKSNGRQLVKVTK